MKKRVLFVCMGNICRSPAAEGVFVHMLEEQGMDDAVEVDSAGTIGFHSGDPADSRMRAAAAKRGYDLTSRARQVSAQDFEEFDWILTMDDANYRDLEQLKPGVETRAKLKRFCDYCSCDTREVPDPYYGGASGFERVLDLLEDGCAQLLHEVRKA